MKRAGLVILVAVLAFAGVMLATGGISDDSRSSEETIEEVQRRNWGAYGCMPPDVRRRFDRVRDRYEARFAHVVKRLPPGADRKAEEDALAADREFGRLAKRISGIIAPYYPGGRKYDMECYERAVERFEGRFEGQAFPEE
jgi:hypothetical protein